MKTVEYELKLKTQDLESTQTQLLESKLNHNEAVKRHVRSEVACERKETEIQSLREQMESLRVKAAQTAQE